jgi:periplasmic divalent cation tolerance protein
MPANDVIAISTTFASREAAEACGRSLVERRLAACVQVEGPLTSVYRWQAAVETTVEWRCTCKTTATREAACIAAIAGLHDYQTPQITVANVRATPSYAAWVHESVAAL